MATDLLIYSPILLVWASLLFNWRSFYRRRSDPVHRSHWFATLTLALCLTILAPPVYAGIDRLSGVPNISRLISNSLAVLTAWILQPFLIGIIGYRERIWGLWRSVWTVVATLSLMTGLFVLAPIDQTETHNFTGRYGSAPFMLEYRLIFIAYMGLVSWELLRLSRRHARRASQPALRIYLGLHTVGWAFGVAYFAHEGLYAIMREFKLEYPVGDSTVVTHALMALAVIPVILSTILQTRRVRTVARWLMEYRACWNLYPLWSDLQTVAPHIALMPARPFVVDLLAVKDLSFKLYRRAVEVRDGVLEVQPYVHRTLAQDADGIIDEDVRADFDARCIAAGLRALISGEAAGLPVWTLGSSDSPGVESEISYLDKVATAYRQYRIPVAAHRDVVGSAAMRSE